MARISLTDFVDFVAKSGEPKLTQVKKVKNRPKYDPRTDFWKKLRDGIIEHHGNNTEDFAALNSILQQLSDKKKKTRYPDALAGYRKFLGKKQIKWFDPPKKIWDFSELEVIVNPELGLKIEGIKYIIKLYFKGESLSKLKIGSVLCLMKTELITEGKNEPICGVLDVTRSKLYMSDSNTTSLLPLLMGEAQSFITIWNNI